MQDNIFLKLSELTDKLNILLNEPMSNHTTFKIGGVADYFVTPKTTEELVNIIKFCKDNSILFSLVGNGSNLLVSDKGIRGVVISTLKLNAIDVRDEKIIAQCGAMLSKVSQVARDNSLSGMEFASGIPGTVGGAVVMNAGAYGGEMKDVVVTTKYCDECGSIFKITNKEHDFSYRHSIFTDNKYYVLSTEIRLIRGNISDITGKMKELNAKRTEKQPLNFPSAGSTFKRPEGYFAAKLIEETGLKGKNVNDAEISAKHAGFLINRGNATAKDVAELINICQKEVKEKFGVDLEPEIKFVGEF